MLACFAKARGLFPSIAVNHSVMPKAQALNALQRTIWPASAQLGHTLSPAREHSTHQV